MQKLFPENDVLDTREGRQFRILSPIAAGGFSQIYRAEEIIGTEKRSVLLKAFYENKQMYDSEERDMLIRHELRMNHQIAESSFTGALTIDYSVHGLYDGAVYGVMTADRPGMTLRKYIDSSPRTLQNRVELCGRLCRLIECFHAECCMVHGDITPENIFLFYTDDFGSLEHSGALALLDFGLTRSVGSVEELPVGGTEGYTHPELLNGQRTVLLQSDDQYSVFSCCWFCFSGQSPDEYEITDEHIEEVCERLTLNAVQNRFVDNPELIELQFLQTSGVRRKSILMMLKDIFLYSRGDMRRIIELSDAIIALLDESEIDRTRLATSLREEYLELRQERFANVDIIGRILPHVDVQFSRSSTLVSRTKQDRPEPLHQVMRNCKDSLFMIGDGGMGKTTSLLQIMDDTYYSNGIVETGPVVFLELYTLSQNPSDWYSPELGGTFIEQFAASYLTKKPRQYVSKDHPYVASLREEFFRAPVQGKRQYTVLLDGANEVGFSSEQSKKMFLDTLNNYLAHAHNLRIILTGRSDIYELNSQYIHRVYTRGLDDLAIEEMLLSAVEQGKLPAQVYRRILSGRYDFLSTDYRLWQCLQVPFFLMMYCVTELKGAVSRQGEILRNFFNDKRETLDGSQTYGEKLKGRQRHSGKKYRETHKLRMDLSIRMILDHIVPEIALQMVIGDTHFLRLEQIKRVIQYCLDTNRIQAKYQNWCGPYYGYEIDTNSILDEIRKIDAGERIPGYICELLGVMRISSDETFSFTHQYFRDYFAACALINRIQTVLEAKRLEGTEAVHNLSAGDKLFAALIYPFQRKLFSPHICALIGEILNESYSIPVFCEADGTWKRPNVSMREQDVLARFLDCYRIAPQNTLDKESSIGFENLIAILKGSRVQNDGRADFSGMALHHLDLKGISLSDVILSRYDRSGTMAFAADFTGSIHVEKALFQNGRMPPNRCIAAHPTKKRILLWNEWDKCVTEYDLEHEEATLICSNLEQIHSVFYCQSSDSIFIVSYQTVIEEKPAQLSGRSKIFQELQRIATPYEEEFEEEEELKSREVQVRMYSRQGRLITRNLPRAERILGTNWSEECQELSLYLQREDGHAHLVTLTVFQIPGVTGEMLAESHQVCDLTDPVVSPLVDLDLSEAGSDEDIDETFMFNRTKEGWYVFASSKWPGNVCFCNPTSGKSASLLYINSLDNTEGLHAIYSDSRGRVCCLYNGNLIEGPDSVYPPGIKPFSYSLSTHYGKIEGISLEEDLLCLNGSTLSRIDPYEKKIVWTADISVVNYFRCGGALIANGTDGIYEIDIIDGSSVCIQRQAETDSQFVTGMTDNKSQIILLDGTGIIKWIDVHTGCCLRQSAVQIQNDTKNMQIYSAQKEHEIWGVNGKRYYIWDDNIGTLKNSNTIPDRADGDFLWAEITEKKILVYFRYRDYNSFPLNTKYFCMFWDVKQRKWLDENPLAQCEEIKFVYMLPRFKGYSPRDEQFPFKIFFSENGSLYMDRAEPLGMRRGQSVLKVLQEEFNSSAMISDDDFEPDNSGELKTGKSKRNYDNGAIEWDPEPWDKAVEREHLTLNKVLAPNGPFVRRLGITDSMSVYVSVNNPSGKCNLWVLEYGRRFQYQLTQLHHSCIKHTWVTDGVVAFHVYNRDIESEMIVFWDIKTQQVYSHRAIKQVSASGCTGVKDSPSPPKDTQDIFHMQGIGENESSGMGASINISSHNTLEGKTFIDHLKSWNFGAMLLFFILTAWNGWLIFRASEADLSVRYCGGWYIITIVEFLILLLAAKAVLPSLVRLSWHGIYGISYLVIMFLVFALSSLLPYVSIGQNLFKNFVFLCIPFVVMHILYSKYVLVILSIPILIFGLASPFFHYFVNWTNRTYYLETYFLVLMVIILTFWLRISKQTRFLRVLTIILMGLVILALIWKVSGGGTKMAEVVRKIVQIEQQGPIAEYCRDVLAAAKLAAPVNVPTPDYLLDTSDLWYSYIGNYFLNYVIQRYGLLPAFGCVALVVGIIVFMIIGIIQQECALDRCICMGCTAFVTIEAVLAILASAGLCFIPPNCMPFFSGLPFLCQGSQFALLIYMSFYRAHREAKLGGSPDVSPFTFHA